MEFIKLAKLYSKLEKMSGKIEMTNLIASFIKDLPSSSLPDIILLLTGNIYPEYEQKEIGIANQLMIKAISRATGLSEDEVNDLFVKFGDLGLAGEEALKKRKIKPFFIKPISVEKVVENLRRISTLEGEKTIDRKISLISELISNSKVEEVKYIIRLALEELRIGVGEGIVRDAIAKAFNCNSNIVERAFSFLPHYGLIAKIAKEKGEEGLKEVKPIFGIPIKVLLAEKAPSLQEALIKAEEPQLEVKYDGMRTQIHKENDKVWLFTRRLENVTKQFPDLVNYVKKYVKCKNCIIEGETIGIDPKTKKPLPFQILSKRIHRKYDIDKIMKEIPIQVNLFDAILVNDQLLTEKPLKERRAILESIVEETESFKLSDKLITKDINEALKFYQDALNNGQEGIMVKNLNSKYVAGRRVGYWWKVKPTMENLDLVIIAAQYGTGKRAGWYGSFVIACRDEETGKFLPVGMLGTGIKEKEEEKKSKDDVTFEELTNMLKPFVEKEEGNMVWFKPSIVIEVAYEEIQKSPNYESGYALRFPRFVRLRLDKSVNEVDTLQRIEYLYKTQRGRK